MMVRTARATLALVVLAVASLAVAIALPHDVLEQPVVLLQVRADYASAQSESNASVSAGGSFRPGGSALAAVAAVFHSASKYVEDTVKYQQALAAQSESVYRLDRFSDFSDSNLPLPHSSFYADHKGSTCSACVAHGRTWCTGQMGDFFGQCSSSSSDTADAQCFSESGLCPTLRDPSPPSGSPASFLIHSTHPDGRPEWDNTPLVDVEHKFIFCEIPKVACTDFKRLFRRLAGAKDYESQAPWVHDPKQNGILRLTDLPGEQAREALRDPTWTKALFVRDPLERLLSGFLDKCRSPASTRYDIHCPFTGEVTFAQFTRYIFDKAEADLHGLMSMDEHWRPQHLVCDLQRWLPYYQFQGNFSHLRTHTKFLLQGTGLFDKFGRGWGSEGADDLFEVKTDWHHTDTSDKLKKYYTRDLADLALKFYKRDYELFSLPTPSWYYMLE